jgi:AraC-like DNA-binding protein
MSINNYFHQINPLKDPSIPCIIHDVFSPPYSSFMMHWHEEIEILYFISGNAKLIVGYDSIEAGQGDTIVINSNTLHSTTVLSESYQYLCIMINKSFCIQNQIQLDNYVYPISVSDAELGVKISSIARENKERGEFYKPLIRAEIIDLVVFLTRKYGTPRHTNIMNNGETDLKLELVKRAIAYIRENFQNQFTIDELCSAVAVSKYYLCHLFKSITNKTIVEYVNIIRCEHAKEMLNSGKFNVTQSAEESGFQDISYFSRTYKRYIGVFPSEEKVKIIHEV